MNFEKNIINDFVNTELSNQYILNDLLTISNMLNLVSYEYECNQYNVIFHRREGYVMIIDIVSEEHGVSQKQTKAVISLLEFTDILKNLSRL